MWRDAKTNAAFYNEKEKKKRKQKKKESIHDMDSMWCDIVGFIGNE